MDGGGNLTYRIEHQDRNTVGGTDAYGKITETGDKRIDSFQIIPDRGPVAHDGNIVAVSLMCLKDRIRKHGLSQSREAFHPRMQGMFIQRVTAVGQIHTLFNYFFMYS